MFKTIRVTKKSIELIEDSVYKGCSMNVVFKMLFNRFNSESNIFWGRFCVKLNTVPDEQVVVRLDEEVLRKIDKVVEYLNKNYRKVKRVHVIEQLLTLFIKGDTENYISVNVRGYRSKTSELSERLKEIAKHINTVIPDMIFVQEIQVGENGILLDGFLNELAVRYACILPQGFDADNDYNMCICVTLIRADLMSKVRPLKMANEKKEWRHRYNMFDVGGRIYLNIWVQQTFGNNANTKVTADCMWAALRSEINYHSNSDHEFYVMGDLNACEGVYENELSAISAELVNTKNNSDICRKTAAVNILDHAFANRYVVQRKPVTTRILEPSIREAMLSDHDALVMTIKV